MQVDPYILLWSYADAHVLDIRRLMLEPGEELRAYRLPVSGFLYAVRGRARILLDGDGHQAQRFYLLHGGKGIRMDIVQVEQEFEYYLILYKAAARLVRDNRVQQLPAERMLLGMTYSLTPRHPFALYEQADQMFREWRGGGPLQRVHIKGLFYQFVHEVLRQLQEQSAPGIASDPVEQVIRYIHGHYQEALTLDAVAELFFYSPRNLRRLFKKRTGHSLMEYVTAVRIDKAKRLLLHTDATLKEIAGETGYPDGYSLSRMFKKITGFSPARFKAQLKLEIVWPDAPSLLAAPDIAPDRLLSYTDYDNYYQHNQRGETTMMRSTKLNPAAVMLLCVTLILSACGGGGETSPSPGAATGAKDAGDASGGNSPASVQKAQTGMRTIQTDTGEVEVPENPQRVMVSYLTGDVVALGVIPAGYTANLGVLPPSYEELVKDSYNFGRGWDFEGLLSKDPDLIIVSSLFGDETIEDYLKIAPSVYIPYSKMSTDERVTLVGQVLNREAEAAQLLASYHAKIEEYKKSLKEAGLYDAEISVCAAFGQDIYVSGAGYGLGKIVYETLGLTPPQIIQTNLIDAGKSSEKMISTEVLPQYLGGDYILYSTSESDDFTKTNIWSLLPAAQNNNVFSFEYTLTFYTDILTEQQLIEEVVTALIEASKRDG